jgi:hypothetical protein
MDNEADHDKRLLLDEASVEKTREKKKITPLNTRYEDDDGAKRLNCFGARS